MFTLNFSCVNIEAGDVACFVGTYTFWQIFDYWLKEQRKSVNKSYLLIPLTFVLAACNSTPEAEQAQMDYLDLSAKDQVTLVEEYWTAVKRVEQRYPVSAAKKNISVALI